MNLCKLLSLLLVLCTGWMVVSSPLQATPMSPSLTFVAIGDMGSGASAQKVVARAMEQAYQKEPFSFVLMLGDNLYPDGNVRVYGKSRFLEPYQFFLQRHIPFYPALGNHDLMWGHLPETLAFFKMPSRYYTFTQASVTFFVIDTNQFDSVQAQWLDRALSKSRTPWNIVYGHHPIYSSGEHGNHSHLIKTLQPLLVKHHVDVYLSGHDHDYERLKPLQGVLYIISGGGGAYLRGFDQALPHSQVRLSQYHFLRFWITPQSLRLDAVGTQGEKLDSTVLNKALSIPFRPAA